MTSACYHGVTHLFVGVEAHGEDGASRTEHPISNNFVTVPLRCAREGNINHSILDIIKVNDDVGPLTTELFQ